VSVEVWNGSGAACFKNSFSNPHYDVLLRVDFYLLMSSRESCFHLSKLHPQGRFAQLGHRLGKCVYRVSTSRNQLLNYRRLLYVIRHVSHQHDPRLLQQVVIFKVWSKILNFITHTTDLHVIRNYGFQRYEDAGHYNCKTSFVLSAPCSFNLCFQGCYFICCHYYYYYY
jgi:hypothetical protein